MTAAPTDDPSFEARLAEWAQAQRLVTPAQLAALAEQRRRGDSRRLDALLQERGLIDAGQLQRFQAQSAPTRIPETATWDEVLTPPGSEARTASRPSGRIPSSPHQAAALRPGSPIRLRPDLTLVHRGVLGQGGMGVVYLVEDPRLGRLAALKLMLEGGSERRALRFQRETVITARLDHPGIPPVYEAGRAEGGQDFLLMRYVRGAALQVLIDRLHLPESTAGSAEVADLSERDLLAALVKIAEAVAYAHSRGIVHRDLKPSNIMIGAFGEVFVMDWGLARDLEQSAEVDASLRVELAAKTDGAKQLTQEGALLGTIGFMAPEQARREDVDARSDVFALGCVLSCILTGEPPFEGGSAVQILAAASQGRVVTPGQRRRLPAELESIARRALAADSGERYASAELLAEDLRAYLEGQPVEAHRYGPLERLRGAVRRHPTWSAALVISLLAVLLALWTRGRAADRAREAARAAARGRADAAWAELEAAPVPALAGKSATERHQLLQRRTTRALAALIRAQRWHALAPDDPDARAARHRAAMALGDVARLDRQWSLADQAFADAEKLGVDAGAASDARAAADAARVAEETRRREAVTRVLERAATGALSRERMGLENAVLEVVRQAGPGEVELLCARLDAITKTLTRATRALWLEARDPAPGESEGRLEGLRAAVDRLLGGQELSGADTALLDRARQRLLQRRVVRQETISTHERPVSSLKWILASTQADALGPRLDVAQLCCEALGRAGIRARAVDALGRYLSVVASDRLAARAAAALKRLGGPVALRALLLTRSRFGNEFWTLHALDDWSDADWRAALATLSEARRARETGERCLRAKDGEQALAAFERLLELEPNDLEGLLGRAKTLKLLERRSEASAAYARAVRAHPKVSKAWSERAVARANWGDRSRAFSDINRAISLEPRSAWNRYYRGWLYLQRNDYAAAIRELSAAIDLDPSLGIAFSMRGSLYLLKGEAAAAERDLLRAIDLNPQMRGVWENLAALRQYRKDWAGMERAADRMIRLRPNDQKARLTRAQARYGRGDMRGALRDLEAVLARDPKNQKALGLRATIHALSGTMHAESDLAGVDAVTALEARAKAAWQRGHLPQAERLFRRLLKHKPDSAPDWANLGEILSDQEKLTEAVACFDHALRIDPSLPGGYAGRGRAYHGMMRLDEAQADLERAAKLAPQRAVIWLNLAMLYRTRKRLAAALQAFDRATKLDPNLGPAWRYQALTAYALGRREEAERAFTHAIQLDPKKLDMWLGRAEIRLNLNQLQGARSDADEAIRLDPNQAAAHALRATIRARLNDRAGAIADCKQTLALTPKGRFADLARKLLRQLGAD